MTPPDEDEFDPNDDDEAHLLALNNEALGATEFGVTAEEEPAPESVEEPDVMVGIGDEPELPAEEAAMHETDL